MTDPAKKVPSTVYGVAVSRDSGTTFEVIPVADGVSNYARYGSFPSESTWYVSSGIWGEDPVTSLKKQHRMTSRVSVHADGVSLAEHKFSPKNATATTTGWYGAVSKTTDAGKTWTNVSASIM